MIFAKEETLDRSEIEKIQLEKLKIALDNAYNNVLPYKKKMDQAGIRPEDIKSLEDLVKLPFTVKEDFRENYPYGMLAVGQDEIVRTHASSGTTGKPTVVGYTEKDMVNWNETVKRVAYMGGARKGMTAQISFGYGLFTGALGLHYGLESMGVNVIPVSTGGSQKQLMFMKDLKPEILIATPSYALYLSETLVDEGYIPSRDFKLKVGLFGGEGLSEDMRNTLNEIWEGEVLFTQNYGMSELNGPGIAGECEYICGMHVMEDHFIVEVVDPDTGQKLPEGEEGELVVTCLSKEALPTMRYRTHDITRIHTEKCQCGRTTTRIEPFKGRTDDMLLIKGVNVFPSQIEEAIARVDEIGPSYEIVVFTENSMDQLEVKVELINPDLLNSFTKLEDLRCKILKEINNILGLNVKVSIHAPRSLKRFEGKARRVEDLRNK